jgi:hypothetical protein
MTYKHIPAFTFPQRHILLTNQNSKDLKPNQENKTLGAVEDRVRRALETLELQTGTIFMESDWPEDLGPSFTPFDPEMLILGNAKNTKGGARFELSQHYCRKKGGNTDMCLISELFE